MQKRTACQGPIIWYTNLGLRELGNLLRVGKPELWQHAKRGPPKIRKQQRWPRDQASRNMQRSLNRSANGRSGSTMRKNPGAARMVRQHVRLGPWYDPSSDAGVALRKGFEMVHRQQQAMENLGRVHRKLPNIFSAKRSLHQASGPGPATEARL